MATNGNGEVVVRALALDVSTSAGWALMEETAGKVTLKDHGTVKLSMSVSDFGPYPWNYVNASKEMGDKLTELVARVRPDVIIIEETNMGRARMTQKLLEFLHNALLVSLEKYTHSLQTPPVFYISTSTWRRALDMKLTAKDKKDNKRLRVAKKIAEASGSKLNRVAVGVRGKVTWKHLSVRYVNERYKLDLKMKDNDAADAICMCTAFLLGARNQQETT